MIAESGFQYKRGTYPLYCIADAMRRDVTQRREGGGRAWPIYPREEKVELCPGFSDSLIIIRC